MSRHRRIVVTDDGLLKFVSFMLVTTLVMTLAGGHRLELLYTISWSLLCIEAVILLTIPLYVVIFNRHDAHPQAESDPCEDFYPDRRDPVGPGPDHLGDLPTVRFPAPPR